MSMLRKQTIPMSFCRAAQPAVGALILLTTAGSFAQTPADPLERSIAYVERCAEATDLFNAERYAEALPIFESLVRSYSDLDTEGFAALGYADTLAALGRIQQARAAYESIQHLDARVQESIRARLEELPLKGPISDAVVNELRARVESGAGNRFAAAWRLGRALQKQAAQSLAEAVQSFRAAAAAPGERLFSAKELTQQALYLDALLADLRFFIDQVEGRLDIQHKMNPAGDNERPATQQRRLEEMLEMPGGQRVVIQIEQLPGSQLTARIDGREVPLSAAERQLLERYQQRINSILLKAADPAAPGNPKEGLK